MDSDLALAARLAIDPEAAFEALVIGHQDRLYSIALRLLGDPRDAEEVAQDALVRAFRAITTYPPARVRGLNLRPWLAAIVVNLARNRRRRTEDRRPPRALDPMLAEGFDPPAPDADLPHALLARRESTDDLATALLRLPPAIRAAVVLRHVAGLSTAEAAEALGRPEGTVKAQVHRGLERLRRSLEPAGPAPSPRPERHRIHASPTARFRPLATTEVTP